MKILITGGAGFLGTRLVRALLQRPQLLGRTLDEIVLADLARPVADLVSNARVRHLVGPLVDQCPAFVSEKFDVVFHLAAAVSAECKPISTSVCDRIWTLPVRFLMLSKQGVTAPALSRKFGGRFRQRSRVASATCGPG